MVLVRILTGAFTCGLLIFPLCSLGFLLRAPASSYCPNIWGTRYDSNLTIEVNVSAGLLLCGHVMPTSPGSTLNLSSESWNASPADPTEPESDWSRCGNFHPDPDVANRTEPWYYLLPPSRLPDLITVIFSSMTLLHIMIVFNAPENKRNATLVSLAYFISLLIISILWFIWKLFSPLILYEVCLYLTIFICVQWNLTCCDTKFLSIWILDFDISFVFLLFHIYATQITWS